MLLKVDDKCVEQWIDLLDGKRKVEKEILKEGGAKSFVKITGGEETGLDAKKEISMDGGKVLIGIKK